MTSVTIFEAKTRLSELIHKAERGESVMITSGRGKKPVATLEPVIPVITPVPMRLGFCTNPDFELGDAFWEPLPKGWDGESD